MWLHRQQQQLNMKNKGVYIISGLIVLIGGYFIYDKFYKKTPKTKEESIAIIVATKSHLNANNILNTFEDGYLIAWADAIEKGKKTFSYQDKTFDVTGGKRLK